MSEETVNQKKLIHDLKVNELRAELEKRSLDKTGVKATLIERLEKALKSEGHDVGTFVFNNNETLTAVVDGNASANVTAKSVAAVTPAEPVSAGTATVFSSESEKAPEAVDARNGNLGDTEATKTTNESDVVAPSNDDVAAAITDKAEHAERDHIIIGSPISVFLSGDDAAVATTEKTDDSVAISTESTTTTTATTEAEMDTNESMTVPAAACELPATSITEVADSVPVSAKTLPIEPTAKPAEANDDNTSSGFTNGVFSAVPTMTTATTNNCNVPVKKEQVSPAKKSADDSAASVWIRGITNSTKAADLKTLFSKHGKVMAAKIFTTKNKLAPTCFGYITMVDVNSANLCIQKLNRTNLKGKLITVEKISKAGRIAASAMNTAITVTDGAPAQAKAPAMAPKTPVMASKPTSSGEKAAETSADVVPPVSATGGESPEIIFEDVRTKSVASANGEKTDDTAQKNESGDQQPTYGKKVVRPRIVVNRDAFGKMVSRRIRPPVDASAPKVNHTTRTAKIISRRVVNTSNTRYRGSAASHVISRASYHSSAGGNTTEPMRRFTTRSIGGSVQRVFNGPVHPGYRGKPHVGLSQRFSTRPGPPAFSSSYGRSSQHHSNPAIGRSSLNGGPKISSWERNELLITMRQREDEYRKKEEELKLQRERERLKFERERLEREKLEIQQMKLTAQLASAQMALIPGAAGNGAVDYGAVAGAFNKPTKPSSSTSKKHSESGAVDSRRDARGREPTERRPSSKAHGRTHSRSRSPHQHRDERVTTSFKRGGNISNYTRGRQTTMRYSDSSKWRYNSPNFSSSVKHPSFSSSGFRGRGTSSHRGATSSRERTRISGGDASHSSSRFSYGSNDSSSGYSRNYAIAGSSGGRSSSPVRRGTVGRSSGTSRDSYSANGVQRFIDDELRGVSQYIARTDPSYASRVTGSNGVGGSSSAIGVSADEMFSLTSGLSGATADYYGSRLSGGGDGYRDSLPSTYQATLSTAGSSGLTWNSGSGRNSYLTNALETSGNWQSGYQSVNTGGRSDWSNDYVSGGSGGGGQHYSGSGRCNSGTASGGSYNSRRY